MGIIKILQSTGLRLLPFINSSLIYLVHWLPQRNDPSPWGILLKCLPIIFLCFFVGSYLYSSGFSRKQRYSVCILTGLIFSGIGDACLVYNKDFFIHGLLFFAVSHFLYSVAFHGRPYRWGFLLPILPVFAVVYKILYPGLKGPLIYLCVIYGLLIITMLWRAIARINFSVLCWTKNFACLGALLFVISDTVLAINKFTVPIPYGHHIIMTTYYTAQLGIALSVVPELEKMADEETQKPCIQPKTSPKNNQNKIKSS
ncbi:lysoplasmalogenase-like protein TMEM86A isoform X2 [Patiria miniata]|uniref:lysoplasmalogenase n=1 Tax=Patiria miniata TaxID=46514 RepID=A0A913ZNB6_PATMI|nr:lysoplasmalogenase-like protein TMEM86A isoform X2 [Patiria miniata]